MKMSKEEILCKYRTAILEFFVDTQATSVLAGTCNSGNLRLCNGFTEAIYSRSGDNVPISTSKYAHVPVNWERSAYRIYKTDIGGDEALDRMFPEDAELKTMLRYVLNGEFLAGLPLGSEISGFVVEATENRKFRHGRYHATVLPRIKEDSFLLGPIHIEAKGATTEELIHDAENEILRAGVARGVKPEKVNEILKSAESVFRKTQSAVRKSATKGVQAMCAYALTNAEQEIMRDILSDKKCKKPTVCIKGDKCTVTCGWKSVTCGLLDGEMAFPAAYKKMTLKLERLHLRGKAYKAIVSMYEKERLTADTGSLRIDTGTVRNELAGACITLQFANQTFCEAIDVTRLFGEDLTETDRKAMLSGIRGRIAEKRDEGRLEEERARKQGVMKFRDAGIYQSFAARDILALVEANSRHFTENICVKMLRGQATGSSYPHNYTNACGKYGLVNPQYLHDLIRQLIDFGFLNERSTKGVYGRYEVISTGNEDPDIILRAPGDMKKRRDFADFTDYEWLAFIESGEKIPLKCWPDILLILDQKSLACLYPEKIKAFLKTGPDSIRDYIEFCVTGAVGMERRLFQQLL